MGRASAGMGEAETGTVIKAIDMAQDMATSCIGFATAAVDQFGMEREMAAHIKKEMDKKWYPTWQCFVGRNFKCSITHETKHYIYFYVGPIAILCFRTADNTPLPIGIPT